MSTPLYRILLAALCLAFTTHTPAQDANHRIVHQGHLEKSGAPVTTPQQFRVNLYTSASGGSPVNPAPYEFASINVSHGEYTLPLDVHYSVVAHPQLWLEISVRPAGSSGAWATLAPRSAFTTQPKAQHAFTADNAEQLAPGSVGAAQIVQTQVQRRVGGACSGGQVLQAIGVTGSATCVTTAGSNVVQNVVTGSGVGGGGNSDVVWVEIATGGITDNLLIDNSIGASDIANAAVGTAALANGAVNAAKINRSEVQAQVAETCPVGKAIMAVDDDGNVTCGVTSLVGMHDNTASSTGTVLSGSGSEASGSNAIALTSNSTASGSNSVAGGNDRASGNQSAALGGTASGNWSVALAATCAGGHYSVALNSGARIRPGSESGSGCSGVPVSGDNGDTGTFLFNGRHGEGQGSYTSTGDDRFIVRASNGFYFGGSGAPSPTIPNNRFINTSTNARLTNGGNWSNASSRAFKHAFSAVDAGALLDRVLALPLGRWQYLDVAAEGWHLGPAAEDFFEAFGLGASVQHITTVDANGVALAAVQGLAVRIEETRRATLAELEQENAQLHAELAQLAARLNRLQARSTEVTP